jgi:hypothetical protein
MQDSDYGCGPPNSIGGTPASDPHRKPLPPSAESRALGTVTVSSYAYTRELEYEAYRSAVAALLPYANVEGTGRPGIAAETIAEAPGILGPHALSVAIDDCRELTSTPFAEARDGRQLYNALTLPRQAGQDEPPSSRRGDHRARYARVLRPRSSSVRRFLFHCRERPVPRLL